MSRFSFRLSLIGTGCPYAGWNSGPDLIGTTQLKANDHQPFREYHSRTSLRWAKGCALRFSQGNRVHYGQVSLSKGSSWPRCRSGLSPPRSRAALQNWDCAATMKGWQTPMLFRQGQSETAVLALGIPARDSGASACWLRRQSMCCFRGLSVLPDQMPRGAEHWQPPRAVPPICGGHRISPDAR